jgi:DNA repair protein RadD
MFTELPETFDPNQQQGSSWELIPVGEYSASIVEIGVMQPQSGNGYYIALTWKIDEGEFDGRQIWQRITFVHSSEQAQAIGRKQLKDLTVACGVTEHIENVDIFLFKRCKIKVGVERDKAGVYDDKNKVMRILPLADAVPPMPPAPAAPKPPTPAPAAPKPQAARQAGRQGTVASGVNAVFDLRPYQSQALDALDAYWAKEGSGNPLLSLATATGKSLLIGWLIRDAIQKYPHVRVLMLVHVQELLGQNVKHLLGLWPDAPLGINCAALAQRDWDQQIIFASIQSIFRSAEKLGRRNLVLIDECHLVPHCGDGTYRTALGALRDAHPALAVCGFSATPFRLDSGHLAEGDDRIFDEIVFDYGIDRGIADGWLSPLSSKVTKTTIDVRDVGRRGGEFIAGELERAADDSAKIAAACDEIVTLGADRKCWLIFCCGISHAAHVRDALRERGIACEAVFGETPQAERERIIDDFRAGRIRALVNVMVLTTGFDVPQVDMIGMLQPTLSTGLYVQMVGRGTRKADGKFNCLILDFAQNIYRHGPVDRVSVSAKNGGDFAAGVKVSSVRAKPCPECNELNPLAVKECIACGYPFPQPKPIAKHATSADAVPILSGQASWLSVASVSMRKHVKLNTDRPPTLCVEYLSGFSIYRDFVAFEHRGIARTFAERFWFAFGGEAPVPISVDEALLRKDELNRPYEISVTRNSKFWNVDERRVVRADGSRVEIDRFYQTWVIHSRAQASRPALVDDAVPY